MEPLALTVADATKALGIKKTKLYSLVNQGKLRVVKIGRRSVVTVSSIKALIEGV